MTCEDFTALALSFPGVEAGLSYGKPAFLLRGGYFTNIPKAGDSVTFQEVSFDEREMLIEADPEVFFVDDHHRPFRMVQARLSHVSREQALGFLERRWRAKGTKAAIKAYDLAKSSIRV